MCVMSSKTSSPASHVELRLWPGKVDGEESNSYLCLWESPKPSRPLAPAPALPTVTEELESVHGSPHDM